MLTRFFAALAQFLHSNKDIVDQDVLGRIFGKEGEENQIVGLVDTAPQSLHCFGQRERLGHRRRDESISFVLLYARRSTTT